MAEVGMVVGRKVLQKPDEKNLLPLFSNVTASLPFNGRRARRRSQ